MPECSSFTGSPRGCSRRRRDARRRSRRPVATTALTWRGAAPVNASGSGEGERGGGGVVGGEAGQQVVLGLPLLPHRERDGHGVLLDHLMRGLPADTRPHGGHEHGRRREERQVAVQLAGDHGGVGAELVEHGQERLVEAVEGEEGVGQRDPAHHGVGDVALVPLRPGQLADHARVAAQQHRQPVDPLGGTGVHLVRHGRAADLARPEALGDELMARHQPDRRGERRRARGELHERGDDVEVERAGVDLADAVEHAGEAEVLGDAAFEIGEAGGIAVEEVEHVLCGAHRALDPAQRVAGAQVLQPVVGDEQLVGGAREALAERGGLGGDVVAAPGHHQLGVLGGAARPGGRGRRPCGRACAPGRAGSAAARRSR